MDEGVPEVGIVAGRGRSWPGAAPIASYFAENGWEAEPVANTFPDASKAFTEML